MSDTYEWEIDKELVADEEAGRAPVEQKAIYEELYKRLRNISGRTKDALFGSRRLQFIQVRDHRRDDGAVQGEFEWPQMAALAMKLTQIVPKNLSVEDISTLDIRPLLAQVMTGPGGEGSAELNGQEFTEEERRVAGFWLVDETEKLRDALDEAIMDGNLTGQNLEDALLMKEEFVYGFRDGTLRKLPTINPVDFGVDAAGNTVLSTSSSTYQSGENVGFDVSQYNQAGAGRESFMTQEEMDDLFAQATDPRQVVGTLMNERNEAIGAANAGVPYVGVQPRVTYEPGVGPKQVTMGRPGGEPKNVTMYDEPAKTYTVQDVARLPSTMSRQEVSDIQKKLVAAGYIEKDAMNDPTNFSDPAFKNAWQMLIGESLERKVPMTELLREKARIRQIAVEKELATSLTDPARLRLNADAMAKQVLGRNLQPEEQSQLVEYLHELERRNAKIAAGYDPDSPEGLEELDRETITADIDARMQNWIREDNLDEASAKDVSDQYDVFSDLLAGPGRGY